MESAPQSTITHNAVIEFASDLFLFPPHACRRGSGGRIKRRPTLPKGRPQIGRDHAKIVSPAQRCDGRKRSISAGICSETGLFARILENPRNGYRTGAAAQSPCPARPKTLEAMYPR